MYRPPCRCHDVTNRPAALALCSNEAEGLWHRLTWLLTLSEEPGRLMFAGRPATDADLPMLLHCPNSPDGALAEMERRGLFRRDSSDTLCCPEMTANVRRRLVRSACGRLGASSGFRSSENPNASVKGDARGGGRPKNPSEQPAPSAGAVATEPGSHKPGSSGVSVNGAIAGFQETGQKPGSTEPGSAAEEGVGGVRAYPEEERLESATGDEVVSGPGTVSPEIRTSREASEIPPGENSKIEPSGGFAGASAPEAPEKKKRAVTRVDKGPTTAEKTLAEAMRASYRARSQDEPSEGWFKKQLEIAHGILATDKRDLGKALLTMKRIEEDPFWHTRFSTLMAVRRHWERFQPAQPSLVAPVVPAKPDQPKERKYVDYTHQGPPE